MTLWKPFPKIRTVVQVEQKSEFVSSRAAVGWKRSEDRRQRILEAAESCLRARGLHQLNIREIARAAGVSLGSVHYYFPSKQHILTELYQGFVKRMSAAARSGASTVPAGDRVLAFLDDYFDELARDPSLCQVFADLWDRAAEDASLRQLLSSHYRAFLRWLTKEIVAGGGVTPREARKRAEMVVALVDGVKVQRLLLGAPGKGIDQRRACKEFVGKLLASNRKQPASGK